MLAKFKKKYPKLAAGSAKTYINNFKRLAKLGGHEKVPDGHAWLFAKKLVAKVRKEPLGRRKLLSAAAVKMARFLGKEPGAWSKLMDDSTRQYEGQRSKQKKTTRYRY